VKQRDADLFKDGSALEWLSQLPTSTALPCHLNLIKTTQKQRSNNHHLLPVKATDMTSTCHQFNNKENVSKITLTVSRVYVTGIPVRHISGRNTNKTHIT
jgi:hypothetical protein